MMKISEQLKSQHFRERAIANLLDYLGRWRYEWRTSDLRVEVWAVGIWTNLAGLISYDDYAQWLKDITQFKAQGLQIRSLGSRLSLVEGRLQSWYAVQDGKCECMLYRQRSHRLPNELPQLWKAFKSSSFCHHSLAASISDPTSA